ncbi:hypothetical protein CMUS01_05681 [Colletotrichum musicola]|uniref:Uncharacterized protein n=1 Tax=Colletotrichum musicola TaxID=2175873 RepID=A0A8H6KRS7_9PEZI|nr:hypothetical protein CMUS01_05681 [Colletotrichum musicola]
MTEPTLPTASLSNDEDDYSDEDEEDYPDPNPALNIKNCNYTKWGLVFYRTTYDAASAQPWAAFKDRVLSQLRASIRESDAPEILDNMDMVFVDDPTLEGASVGDLQRRFREWVREDTGGAERGDGGARHEFFVKVDEVGLHAPYVSLVRGFPEEYGEEGREHVKIWHIAIGIELYDELGDPNAAWTGRYYRCLPTHLVAQGY